MKVVVLLLQLLSKFFEALEKRQRKREQQEHEEAKQDAQDDPHGWFNDHFNGDAKRVRGDEAADPSDGVRADADETGKAKPTKPDENR